MSVATARLLDGPAVAELPARHFADIDVRLADPEVIAGPRGTRMTYVVEGGTVRGPAFNAELLPGGGDWVVVGTDLRPRLDIRATLRADDGSLVHLAYGGVIDAPPEALQGLAAGTPIPEEAMAARILPRYETASERYAWINRAQFVGFASLAPNRITYRVLQVL